MAKRTLGKHSKTHDENEPLANEFELARLKRIERNRQVMVQMGCLDTAADLAASRPKKAKKAKLEKLGSVQLEPTRKSRRLASQPAEVQQLQHV